VQHHLFDRRTELKPAVEPGVEGLQPAHGDPPPALSI
jgi:hypothetical protein